MSLHGRVALVTGSTSGIGLGIARALSQAGATLVLNGFGDPSVIAGLVASLPPGTTHDPADMADPAQIRALIARTEPDILVNNAGIQLTASLEAFPDEGWDRVIAINLSSAFHTIKAAIPTLRRRGWGRIINIASAHGLVASPAKAAYVAAKHGLIGLTKVAALELANTGATCNAICPGWALTPLVEKQLQDRSAAEGASIEEVTHRLLAEKQPLHQFTTPAQIGAMAAFLCSPAADTITGAPLSMDGGWLAQ